MSQGKVEDHEDQQTKKTKPTRLEEKFPWYVEYKIPLFDVIMMIMWLILLIGYTAGLIIKGY